MDKNEKNYSQKRVQGIKIQLISFACTWIVSYLHKRLGKKSVKKYVSKRFEI